MTHPELSNLWLFARAILKLSITTGFGVWLAGMVAVRKYIQFVECDVPKQKTHRWLVQSIADALKSNLGFVKWFGRWRCYAFFPFRDCVFEKKCLREIAQFCEDQTKSRKAKAA